MRVLKASLALALLAGAVVFPVGSGSATPFSNLANAIGASQQDGSMFTDVQFRRYRGYRGRRGGDGAAAAAIIGGLIIGGIIASEASRSRGYYDNATAYCMRRFKSYDPYSRTYLGYDGYRHPCP